VPHWPFDSAESARPQIVSSSATRKLTQYLESKLDDSVHDYCPAAFPRLRFAKISM